MGNTLRGTSFDTTALDVLGFATVGGPRWRGQHRGLVVSALLLPVPLLRILALGILAGACSATPVAHHGVANHGDSTPWAASTSAAARGPVKSSGCTAPAAAPVSGQRQTVTVDGIERWYLLTTPPEKKGSGPLPVVVDLHGLGEGAQLHSLTSQFGTKAKAAGFIVAFPEGTGSPVAWDINPSARPNKDIDFMNAVLDALEARFCVDRSRQYATGISDGAIMTSLLACTMADRFAAFAPVAGIIFSQPCHPGRPVAIVAFHGTADPILHFNGGVGTVLNHAPGNGAAPTSTTQPPADLHGPGYPAYVQDWAAKDRCRARPTDTHVRAHVILRTYRCPPGAAVEFYIVLGGGHGWPGSRISASLASINGPSTFEVNATDLIWQFFSRYHLS